VRGREVWEPRVRRLRESDLTVAEFAAELGVKPSTLTYWKWRLGKEARGTESKVAKARRAPKFVEVKADDVTPTVVRERIEIVVEGGAVIRVPEGFRPETLRQVMAALARQSS
jgi:transposase-like protein